MSEMVVKMKFFLESNDRYIGKKDVLETETFSLSFPIKNQSNKEIA